MESDDNVLDVRGMNCPMPIILTKKSLNELYDGEILKIIATDPGTERDFQVLCEQPGYDLVKKNRNNGEFTYLIKKTNSKANNS